MLRRRTGELIWTVLLAALVAGLVGAVYVIKTAPELLLHLVVPGSLIISIVACAAVDEAGWLFVALTLILFVLGTGLCALHLLGVSANVIALVAVVLAGLIALLLGRALIAAGSADYPYDD